MKDVHYVHHVHLTKYYQSNTNSYKTDNNQKDGHHRHHGHI